MIKGSHRTKESNRKMVMTRMKRGNYKHSLATRKKFSKSRLGEKNPMFGKHFSEESKIKMSNAQKGEKSHNWGKHLSEETKTKMRNARLGDKGSNWKGGRSFLRGYILIWDLSRKSHYFLEHRQIAEKQLGKPLTEEEIVHHINGIRNDNRLENLYLFPSQKEHIAYHNLKNKSVLTSNIISA